MARKPTEADKLAKDLERQLAALNAQPSPVDVVRNITNQTVDTSKPTYEGMRSQLSEIKDPNIKAALEKAYAGADVQTQRLQTQAEALGYTVNPDTGALQPIASNVPPPPSQQQQQQLAVLGAHLQALYQQNQHIQQGVLNIGSGTVSGNSQNAANTRVS